MQLDPELELYAMPQRELVRSDEDIKILVDNFPEKSRATFLDWYEGYKVQVREPYGPKKSKGPQQTVRQTVRRPPPQRPARLLRASEETPSGPLLAPLSPGRRGLAAKQIPRSGCRTACAPVPAWCLPAQGRRVPLRR